jgi:hypothetical protein
MQAKKRLQSISSCAAFNQPLPPPPPTTTRPPTQEAGADGYEDLIDEAIDDEFQVGWKGARRAAKARGPAIFVRVSPAADACVRHDLLGEPGPAWF